VVSEETILKNLPIRNKNCLWRPQEILVFEWSISKKSSPLKPLGQMNRKHPSEVLYNDCGFRGDDFKKSSNKKQELPVAAKFVNGSEQNVHSL
jgi:hypothetical protein